MDIDQISALLEVLDHGSMLGASKASGIARGTLRARIESLERQVGTALLVRDRAGVSLTDAGRRVLPHLRAMRAAQAHLHQDLEEFALGRAGEIELVMFDGAQPQLAAMVAAAARRHLSGAPMRVIVAADPVAEARPETDVVLHFGEPPPDPRWYSRVIYRLNLRLVASPTYLEERGSPRSIEDLEDHDLLLFSAPAWPTEALPTPRGPVAVRPVLRTADIELLWWMAALGQGIALVPDGEVPDTPGRPPVVRVLDDRVSQPLVIRASTLNRALPRVQRILEGIAEVLPSEGSAG